MKLIPRYSRACVFFLFSSWLSSAQAANSIGTIDNLEVWSTGNIGFTLRPAVTSCNGQFILNVSTAGTKNQYALLLAAKTKGVQVQVLGTGCGPAEGYTGAATYNLVSYIYILDS